MKILFLQKRVLFPANTGGKIRTLNVVKHLAQWHEVTYLCNHKSGEEPQLAEMQALGLRVESIPWHEAERGSLRFYRDLAWNLVSPHPFNVDKDYDPRLRRRAQQLLKQDRYDLVVCDFVQMARNALGLGVPSVLFQHNVEAQIFARHAVHDAGRFRRWYMDQQAKKMRRFEAAAGCAFTAVVAVSAQDKALFERDYGWRHVHEIDTAVDTDYFSPRGIAERAEEIVFVGSLDWLPNQDGVLEFVRNVWPRVRAELPQATFRIVGRNPTAEVAALADQPGVEVVGTVPDIRPHVERAGVFVVPLRIGGGTRLKIYEAMAMGKAVVSTTLGAEGLPLHDGEHLLLADEPAAFAAAVVRVARDAELRRRLGAQGQALVRERYSAETVARQFESICVTAARFHPSADERSDSSLLWQVSPS